PSTHPASLKVDPTELASIQVSPKNAEIPAGGTLVYSAAAFAANCTLSLHVALPIFFSVDGTGTCTDNACGSEKAGDYTVTGTDGTFTDTASHRNGTRLNSTHTKSPNNAEIPADGTRVYSAEGFDAHGNDLGDVTTGTVFSVDATELASITISPKNAEIPAGGTRVYSAECFDAHGNHLGHVSSPTRRSSDLTGTCTDNACGSEKAGDYTVTGTDGTFTDTA